MENRISDEKMASGTKSGIIAAVTLRTACKSDVFLFSGQEPFNYSADPSIREFLYSIGVILKCFLKQQLKLRTL